MSREYFYPDVNDKITTALIKEKEPFRGYWEKSEKKILNLTKSTIKMHISNSQSAWLLDSGCGTGRLLLEYEKNFGHILAIDPDFTRIEKAKQLAKEHEFADKVVFQIASAEELELKKESIDVILCSHVLQHVSTESVTKILQEFSYAVKKDGLLFIMTTHSKKGSDYYVKDYLQDSKPIEEEIGEKEFNSLIKNDRQVLPLHFFSTKNISNILKSNGFFLLDFRSFHILCKSTVLDKIVDRDYLMNTFSFLKIRSGRDLLIVAQK